MRVLVTRPAEDCARTAALLRSRGHEAVPAPLFSVRTLPAELAIAADAVLAASANALRRADPAGLAGLTRLPLFAVGAATAAAAREAGFRDIRAAGGDSLDLARLIAEGLPAGARLLHLAGRPRRDEAIAALDGRFRIAVAETYATEACDALPPIAAEALREGRLDAVLHFSPRAARVFADLAEAAGLMAAARRLRHVFISAAAADGRLPEGRIAQRPSLESVVDAL